VKLAWRAAVRLAANVAGDVLGVQLVWWGLVPELEKSEAGYWSIHLPSWNFGAHGAYPKGGTAEGCIYAWRLGLGPLELRGWSKQVRDSRGGS